MDKRMQTGKKRQKSIAELFKKPAKNVKSSGDQSVVATSIVRDTSVGATSTGLFPLSIHISQINSRL